MILDENTTIFLIQVLNEADEMGGGVSLTPYEQTVDVVDPKTGKSKKVKNKQNEDKFYKDQLQNILNVDPENKIDLENEDTSKPSLGLLAGLGIAKRRLGYKTDPYGSVSMKGDSIAKDVAQSLAGGALAGTALQFMGPLGQAVSGKLPYLAALGVDPLDYATKLMGVDYVRDQLGKLGARQAKQITAGQGYPTL